MPDFNSHALSKPQAARAANPSRVLCCPPRFRRLGAPWHTTSASSLPRARVITPGRHWEDLPFICSHDSLFAHIQAMCDVWLQHRRTASCPRQACTGAEIARQFAASPTREHACLRPCQLVSFKTCLRPYRPYRPYRPCRPCRPCRHQACPQELARSWLR